MRPRNVSGAASTSRRAVSSAAAEIQRHHLRLGQLQVRALDRLGIVALQREPRRLAQRRDRLRVVRLVVVACARCALAR